MSAAAWIGILLPQKTETSLDFMSILPVLHGMRARISQTKLLCYGLLITPSASDIFVMPSRIIIIQKKNQSGINGGSMIGMQDFLAMLKLERHERNSKSNGHCLRDWEGNVRTPQAWVAKWILFLLIRENSIRTWTHTGAHKHSLRSLADELLCGIVIMVRMAFSFFWLHCCSYSPLWFPFAVKNHEPFLSNQSVGYCWNP